MCNNPSNASTDRWYHKEKLHSLSLHYSFSPINRSVLICGHVRNESSNPMSCWHNVLQKLLKRVLWCDAFKVNNPHSSSLNVSLNYTHCIIFRILEEDTWHDRVHRKCQIDLAEHASHVKSDVDDIGNQEMGLPFWNTSSVPVNTCDA